MTVVGAYTVVHGDSRGTTYGRTAPAAAPTATPGPGEIVQLAGEIVQLAGSSGARVLYDETDDVAAGAAPPHRQQREHPQARSHSWYSRRR